MGLLNEPQLWIGTGGGGILSAYRRQASLRATEYALLDFAIAVGGCYAARSAIADAGVSGGLCRRCALTPFCLYRASALACGFSPGLSRASTVRPAQVCVPGLPRGRPSPALSDRTVGTNLDFLTRSGTHFLSRDRIYHSNIFSTLRFSPLPDLILPVASGAHAAALPSARAPAADSRVSLRPDTRTHAYLGFDPPRAFVAVPRLVEFSEALRLANGPLR